LTPAIRRRPPDHAGNSHHAEPCEQARRAAYGRADPGTGTGTCPNASSAAEFVPQAATMKGSVVRNTVGGVTAGLGSEAGGQAAEGTAYEMPARVLGAVPGA
jgi:hypothetical protein